MSVKHTHNTGRLQDVVCNERRLSWRCKKMRLDAITPCVHNLHVHKHCCRCCKYSIIASAHIRHPTLALLTRPAEFPIITTVKTTSQGLQSFSFFFFFQRNAKVSSRRPYLINRCSQCKRVWQAQGGAGQ